jgi:hypothetical protein
MNGRIGFDRIIELDWLDLIAVHFAQSQDANAAFSEARAIVAASVGGGSSPHNATGKTMTVLARIWLKVPPSAVELRDAAAQVLPSLSADERMAVHWAMCELAYPFYLDAAAVVGRTLAIQDAVSLSAVRGRLTERWGARGTMPAAIQRLMQTWVHWKALSPTNEPGQFVGTPRRAISAKGARFVAEARVLAEGGRGVDLDDLQHAPDLFPFTLPELRPVLEPSRAVQLAREAGRRWVARSIAM